jgi:histone H3/H4
MRNATIEAEVREEAAQEMQEALKKMHADFAKMFQDQVCHAPHQYLTHL